MVEIQNLVKEHAESDVFGAVVFILDPQNKVFTFIEQEDKPRTGKKVGDYAVLCETREKHEPAAMNMLRGVHEELGISYKTIPEVLDLHDVKIWETSFMPGVWSTVTVVRCPDPSKFEQMIGTECSPDGVKMGGWKTRQELESLPIRVGVRNILDKFASEIFEI
jgi:hypothetical protein